MYTMDIYSFIPSRDIAAHCRKIEHKFTPLEQAFIVYLSGKIIPERHKAWQWIIDNLPDMEVPERPCMLAYDSLHQFLCDYMALENELMAKLREDEPGAVYTYKSYDIFDSYSPNECDTLFTTHEAMIAAIKAENAFEDIKQCRIRKRWTGDDSKEISADITYGGTIRVWERGIISDEKKNDLMSEGFEGMWTYIPTPFKKGDIVIDSEFPREPFVLTDIIYWLTEKRTQEWYEKRNPKWDTTDMVAGGYGIGESGGICPEDDARYHRLEYYPQNLNPLKGKDRALLALSNYIKDEREISECLLLNAYGVISRETRIKRRTDFISEHYLEAAGLKINPADTTEPPTNEHTDIYSFIPSRDIALHCRALAHEFSSLEKAAIIYHSKKTMHERHAAWRQIIETQPDMKILESPDSKYEHVMYESLHEFLTEYMRVETSIADKLKTSEPNTIYTFRVCYTADNPYYFGRMYDSDYNHTPYSTFDAVMEAIKKDSEEEEYIYRANKRYEVQKRWIDDCDMHLSAEVTTCGSFVEIELPWQKLQKSNIISVSDVEIFSTFNEVNVYVPVPFQKGDILTYTGSGRPFVLRSDEWRYGLKKYPNVKLYRAEGSVMDEILSYCMLEGGTVYNDFSPASLSLEYYRAELTGLNRVLIPISNHMKGELPVDLMMNAYDIIIHEERLKELNDGLHYTQEGLVLAGLGESNQKSEGESCS